MVYGLMRDDLWNIIKFNFFKNFKIFNFARFDYIRFIINNLTPVYNFIFNEKTEKLFIKIIQQ